MRYAHRTVRVIANVRRQYRTHAKRDLSSLLD
jgi:hypothetical protein